MMVTRSALRREIEHRRPDVIELSDRTTLSWLPEWAASREIPTVFIAHERLEAVLLDRSRALRLVFPLVRQWRRTVSSHASAIVTASAYAAEDYANVADRVRIVPLGVDHDVFAPSAASAEPVRPPYALFAGRLSPEKRPQEVVRAWNHLRDGGIRLVVAGNGPLAGSLRRMASGLNVEFVGHVAGRGDLARLMADATMVIAPSPFETFGLTVAEALSCGTPVVVADTGSGRELIGDSCGVAVRPTAAGIAGAVRELARADRDEMRRRCAARSVAFSWSATAASLLWMYSSLATRERRMAA